MKFVNTVLCLFFVTFPVIAGEVFYSSTYRLVAKDSSDEIRLRCFQEYTDNMGRKAQTEDKFITIHSKQVGSLVTITPRASGEGYWVSEYGTAEIVISGRLKKKKCGPKGWRVCLTDLTIDRNSGDLIWWEEATIDFQRQEPQIFGVPEYSKGIPFEYQCRPHKAVIP